MSRTLYQRSRPLIVAGGLLIVVIGAYSLGRGAVPMTSGSAPAPVPKAFGTQEGQEEEHHEEEAGHPEEGVVRLDEQSLPLADLRIETVQRRFLPSRLAVTGAVEPNLGGLVKVTPRVAGKITSVRVNVGDNVRAGQSLATLASVELARAQAAHRQAAAEVKVAWSHLQRQRQLARLGAFGQPRVEEARAAAIAAQGEVATARNQVAAARNQVAEARSERAARDGEVASAAAEADSARSEVAEAESQLRALQAALAQAHTQVGVAQSRFERADLLLKEQLVSRQEWEQAQAERQHAQADVDAARASIAQGQAKIEAAKARLNAAQARAGAARGRRQQATASIETALARQAQAEAKLAAIQKQSEIASQALAREEAVFQGGYLTSQEIVAAEAAWRQAQLDQQAAADSVRLLGGSPGGTNALTVTAPLGGRVTERLVTLGEMVTPDRTLFTIINLHTVWLQLNVHQQDLPGVRTGQRVTVTSDIAPGRTFSGAISYVGDMVDETTRTVKVRCVVQNKGGRLRPQTFVRGTIATDVRAPVLAVPQDAVQTYAGKTVVFAQGERPGEFEAKEVQTGASVDGWTVIASGLAAGDRVVTRGAFIIKAQAMKSELEHHD